MACALLAFPFLTEDGKAAERGAQALSEDDVLFLRCGSSAAPSASDTFSFSKAYKVDPKAGEVFAFDGARDVFVAAGQCAVGPDVITCQYDNPGAAQYQSITIHRADGAFRREITVRDVHITSEGACRKSL
ncbi:hypothetical protein [Xanthobacter sp. 126]|jgi:hypothetical protein|uniref:hypothetical protein n=1 Tax=Xanthobacter sp. 126 TaxID=1131814 RepID=UPI00045EA2B0|nr:hypothetical protein [Xanthobacter sp. 126]